MRTTLLVLCVLVTSQSRAFILSQPQEPKAGKGLCQQIDSCSCRYEDGSILDLSPLASWDGLPAFENVTDEYGDTYVSWNPCQPFSIAGTECTNTAICAVREGIPNTLYYTLGGQDSARFIYNENGSLVLTYTMDQGDFKRSAEITLQCMYQSHFDFFVNEGEGEPDNETIIFRMILASRHACAYEGVTTQEPVTTVEPFTDATREPRRCTQITSCSCRLDDGTVMSLEPLASDYSARFYRIRSPNEDYVYWNPCIPFTLEDANCENVAVCVEVEGSSYSQYVGYKDYTASFGFDNYDNLVLIYTTSASGLNREVQITLHCGSYYPDVFTPGKEEMHAGKLIYSMALYSQYACGIQLTTMPPPTTAEMTTEPMMTTSMPDQCKQTGLCSCRYSDGRTLNLQAVSKYDGTPFFENEPDKYGDLISWNPCATFTVQGTECEDVFLCVASPKTSSTHVDFRGVRADIGVTFSVDEYGDQVITYHSVDASGIFKTNAEVHLQCLGNTSDSSPNFFMANGQPTSVGDADVFKMVLASKYACAKYADAFPEKKNP